MLHTSSIELSKSALKTNLNFIRRLIGKKVRLSTVVKGNAYGHGIETLVPLLEELGVDHFAVFNAEEAEVVCRIKKKPDSRVMIMGMIENEDLPWAIEQDIEFFVFELDRLHAALSASQRIGKPARIHIEVETGMNRTGFGEESAEEVINLIQNHPEQFEVVGVCTHLAGAERVENYLRIQTQIARYHDQLALYQDAGIHPKYRHIACSAGVVRYPETHLDMVRVGILTYGFWPSSETLIDSIRRKSEGKPQGQERYRDPLKRVITWKSSVMSVKEVNMGEFIGYGTAFMAPKRMKIALVPVGYAYGFGRSLSNVGKVLIRNRAVQVVGFVNMNLVIINIKEVPEVQKGDEVILIGKQGKRTVSVSAFGEMSNQLNYELLTRLPLNLPRTVVD
ncbi:MAG TPA: alanine racemase [Cytophagales bacterium]|nr:alanine racemase [Cytophagales bacterium]HAP60106.1 alanine racemase [Cytophagales bacterium]